MASIISAVIVMAIFVAIVVVILLEKMNRAIISLIGALGAFLALTFIDGAGFMTFIEFMFGNALDNYVNFHSLLLILGMSIIVQICYDAGVFQFIAFSLVKTTRGKAMHLLIMLCFLTFVLSSILNNIMTVMIMIPLSITMSRILAIDPRPYILTQAILVNVGGILFPISSIPGILVATAAGIPFIDFFIGIGLFAFVLLGITLALFYVIYKPKLAQPQPEYVEALAEFNAWNFVQDRPLLIKSIVTLLAVLVCFIAIPSDLLSPDIIALSAAVILVVISKVKSDDLVGKLNMGNFLSWTFSDPSVADCTYSVSRDGLMIITNATCTPGVPVNISIDGLSAGIHVFFIMIDDGYGVRCLDVVYLTVTANDNPMALLSNAIITGLVLLAIIIAVAIVVHGLLVRRDINRKEMLKRVSGSAKGAKHVERDSGKIPASSNGARNP